LRTFAPEVEWGKWPKRGKDRDGGVRGRGQVIAGRLGCKSQWTLQRQKLAKARKVAKRNLEKLQRLFAGQG